MDHVALIVIFLQVVHHDLAQREGMTLLESSNQCICPGHILTYECTIESGTGVTSTLWNGTAFDCPDTENQINLLHTRKFTGIRGCSYGAILGQGVRVMGNRYTSQLNITVDSYMEGKSVACFHKNGSSSTLIGNLPVIITTDPLPPPTDVSIIIILSDSDAPTGPLKLKFQWNSIAPDCTAIGYITSLECGSCPNTTTNTEVVCTDIVIGDQCMFTVQTQVCDSIISNITTVPLTLKVPDVPIANVIPTYSHETKALTSLTVLLGQEMETFQIFEGITGSPVSYSLLLTDFALESSVPCASANNSTSCFAQGTCHYTFNLSSATCKSKHVLMQLSAINILGSGPPYNTTVEFINEFVEVTFNPNFTVVNCTFLNLSSTNCNCSLAYGMNKSEIVMGTAQSDSNTVVIPINTTILDQNPHFVVTASNGNHTVHVEGIIRTTGSESSPHDPTQANSLAVLIVIYTTIAIIITLGILVVIILGLLCLSMKRKLNDGLVKTKTRSGPVSPSIPSSIAMAGTSQMNNMDRQMNDTEIGVYSLLQSADDENVIYAEIGPVSGKTACSTNILDDRVEYSELKHEPKFEILQCQDLEPRTECDADKFITLDSLLIQLREKVTDKWYELGQALGVPVKVMETFKGHPSDQCMIETLDYWLRNHPDQPTWREVTQALDAIGFSELSREIAQVYVTGKLPIEVDMNTINLESVLLQTEDQPPTSEASSDYCNSLPLPLLPTAK